MQNIETLYSSYQELLLDLDIYGRLVGSQNLDDKEAFKDLLFQEYAKSRPIPTLESRDCELSEPVSEDFHVSYMHELELSQGEEVINWDDDEDEDTEGIDIDSDESVEIPDDFPRELFSKPLTIEERDSILNTNEYFKTKDVVEEFSGSVEEVVSNFGSIEQSNELVYEEEYDEYSEDEFDYDEDEVYEEEYVEEEEESSEHIEESTLEYDSEDEDTYSYDEDEEFSYDDDVYEEDELFESDVGDSVEDEDSFDLSDEDFLEDEGFVDEVYDNPKPVEQKPKEVYIEPPPIVLPKPNVVEEKVESKEEIPSDILQYLRLHPRCEISEVLKYYPRKDLERYIRIGKVIKKGSKVYI